MRRFKTQSILTRAALTLLVMMLTTTTAWAETENLGGYDFTIETDGEGSYYKVDSEAALRALSSYVNAGNNASGKRFKQTADIILNGDFMPIGASSTDLNLSFNGSYDGSNFAISGLKVDIYAMWAGLFGYVVNGTIKNIILVNPDVKARTPYYNSYAGAVVGHIKPATIKNCYVINPTVKATNGSNNYKGAIVGGILDGGRVDSCFFYSTDDYNIVGFNQPNAPVTNSGHAYTLTLGTGVTTSTDPVFSYGGTNYYAGTITLGCTAPLGYAVSGYIVNNQAIEDNTFSISADAIVSATFADMFGMGNGADGSAEHPYIISSAEGWDYFCDCLQDNDTWNRFSGKTVKLGADISVTRMAGADYHDFLGTFDGGSNTLTFTATATDSYLAPFSNVLGSSDTDHAVIRNLKVETNITANDYRHMAGLIAKVWGYVDVTNCDVTVNITATKGDNNTDLYPAGIASQVVSSAQLAVSGCTVDGTISTNGQYAGGIIGIVQGSASITDCVSSVTIDSSTEGDGTHGGLVAVQGNYDGSTITIEGCVFNGKLLGTSTTCCGGFVGWRQKTVNISNSLFALAEVTIDDSDCYTFSRRSGTNITNCYYAEALGELQGKQARSITAGEGVTVEFSGTAAEYGTSGITAYGTGMMYDGVLYAGNEDQVSLNLDGSTTGYIASAGTLTGEENPFTLIMPDEDVVISAAPQYQRGDVNQDGSVNIADVTALIDYLLSDASAAPAEADVNQDGFVNIADVTTLIDLLLGGN